MKILLVEDEPVLLDEIATYFKSHHFTCEHATTFKHAEQKLTDYLYDIVVLDITLPDGNGIELIEKIKQKHLETGILMLSAKHSLQDKLNGFNLGADDYLTKPFYLEELNARVNAIYRRKALKGAEKITFDGITIEPLSKSITFQNQEIGLTRKECELLIYFVINKDRVVSRTSIVEHLWGDHFDQNDSFDTIYVHMMNLRKKLLKTSGKDYIKTVYGIGYKFTF
ncbi:response regulator transcription factor [Pedobacter sp. Hv1]|uniref:response regulator transcription factor n=1 Tax=Pedobacter sp. Hv1 TaxID=1740090 RepID=UPI0006D8CCC0|nr:response regulator transcription factor [Pedobacter sp. Hv1]KQC00715.1 two-component system response regulator [Pedobacter sp. Hv1]